jgi:3'-5' exoribonuclease
MKDFYVRDCQQHESQTITSSFVVASKQVKTKKNGDPYLALTLADRTGQFQANMWDNVSDAMNEFEQDDFVKVKGMVQKYNGRWQLTLHKVRKLGDTEIEYSDFLPKTSKDIDQLWRTLGEFVASIENLWLQRLIKDFMADETVAPAYKNAPAAKTMHHAYVGGLLDHVVSLMTSCDLVVRNYPQVNRDLLLTGAFLHDIGKIHELAYQRSISYTTRGQLLGHMIIELEMLHEKLSHIPGFPDDLKTLIEHLIISHHGQYEFGSPKLPMFPEALMLHYLDDLDSKMESMRAQFDRESELETAWTSYNPSLARTLLNTQKFLERGSTASAAASLVSPAAENMAALPEEPVASKPNPEADSIGVIATGAEKPEPTSPLDALQRKFASYKPTPAGVKGS